MKKPLFIATGAISACLSVAFGAFGAHALKQHLSEPMLAIFHTAVNYQASHSLALILIGLLYAYRPLPLLLKAGWFMLSGILLFSGSLYILSLSGIKLLGAITPIGGVALLIGWAILAFVAIKEKI